MKIKSYNKGQHTYTVWGKGREVRKNSSQGPKIEYDENCSEVYANQHKIQIQKEVFLLSFGHMLFPANKISKHVDFKLDKRTAGALAADLKNAMKGS